MYNVVNTTTNSLNRLYGDLGVKVAGKTGTAQVSTTHPHNALTKVPSLSITRLSSVRS